MSCLVSKCLVRSKGSSFTMLLVVLRCSKLFKRQLRIRLLAVVRVGKLCSLTHSTCYSRPAAVPQSQCAVGDFVHASGGGIWT